MKRYTTAVLAAAVASPALAGGISSVTLDGIYDAGNDVYSNETTVSWYNGHKGDADDTDETSYHFSTLQQTTIRYGVGKQAGVTTGPDYFFLYLETPLEAKNMIWVDKDLNDDFEAGNLSLGPDAFDGYHNKDEDKSDKLNKVLDFGGATGSEKFQILDQAPSGDKKDDKDNVVATFDIAKPDKNEVDSIFGLIQSFDSWDYLRDEGLATLDYSDNADVAMSVEAMFSVNVFNDQLISNLTNYGLSVHLSPERQPGFYNPPPPPPPVDPPSTPPTSAIPSPTAMLAGGLGLLGLVARRGNRRNMPID